MRQDADPLSRLRTIGLLTVVSDILVGLCLLTIVSDILVGLCLLTVVSDILVGLCLLTVVSIDPSNHNMPNNLDASERLQDV